MAQGHGTVAGSGGDAPVGRFGRLFPNLKGAQFGATLAISDTNMRLLGAALTADFDAPKDGPDNEESGIPALFTYFGQFVDHDLTFGPEGSFHTTPKLDPAKIADVRTPSFDLDCVYGHGPDDQPYLYQEPGAKGERRLMLLGGAIGGGSVKGAHDLPRNSAGRALIGDKRNDENAIVSQLQGLFLRFHNRLAYEDSARSFDEVRQAVQWHYQWIVLNDFLPRIVNSGVVASLKTGGAWDRTKLRIYTDLKDAFMPVEFSVAAYRLGHSMIRPGYRLNDAVLLPIFPLPGDETRGSLPLPQGLTGFRPMVVNWGIDWGRFIDLDTRGYGEDPATDGFNPNDPANAALLFANFRRLQFAYRIDTSLVDPLRNLPPEVTGPPSSLAERNLKRGVDFGLPSGQDVANYLKSIDVPVDSVIDPKAIQIGKATGEKMSSLQDALKAAGQRLGIGAAEVDQAIADLGKATPLWVYCLAEAAAHQEDVKISVKDPGAPAGNIVKTPRLGPVGGRIVAETFLALMFADPDSYLNAKPDFVPHSGPGFGLKEFVQAASA